MKTVGTIILAIFLLCNLVAAQDTLYICKSGAVVTKRAVNDIDSVIFYKPNFPPAVVTDIDGNIYHTVTIGTQTWMVENLKTTKYNDGTSIPYTFDANTWSALSTPGYCYYNNDAVNKITYGALYNWYTVNTGKLAPTGWHVPTDAEWTTLEDYLIANGYNYDGTTTGNKIAKSLAATTLWNTYTTVGAIGNDLTKNNTSGFAGLPGGYRVGDGSFGYVGGLGSWWSSTQNYTSIGWFRNLYYDDSNVSRGYDGGQCGFSVRCVRVDIVPILNTTVASNITTTSALSGGYINYDGGIPVITSGVCWNTTGSPTTADRTTTDGTLSGFFTSSITGLTPGTTYYIRAWATNSFGTGYGNVVSIQTKNETTYGTPFWKALTGGANPAHDKTWVLDLRPFVTTTIDDAGNAASTTANKSIYFHNPLDFYGDNEAGGSITSSWGPWGGTDIYGWGGTPEDGSITFDAMSGTVKLTIDGVTTTGKYQLQPEDRPEDIIVGAKIMNADVAISLWENMLTGKYSYLGTLSPQIGWLKFDAGLRFPLDKGRVTNDGNTTYPSQFLTEDLENVCLIHCSDSSLIVRIKRTYEGAGNSKCWLLYNFVVKEYNYPTPATSPTHSVLTDLTPAILAGTWKTAPVPYNWISWSTKATLCAWPTPADMIASGWAGTQASLDADALLRVSFNANGSAVINGQATTYTIKDGGYITFADPVSIPTYMMTLTGKHVYGVKVLDSTDGLWLGQNNGSKEETSAIHFVKE